MTAQSFSSLLDIDFMSQIAAILEEGRVKISDIRPSDWAESNIIMPKPFPGPLEFWRTPFMREILDCLAPDHPAREIALMASAQIGKTMSVLVPAIGYIISQDPGPIIMTVGHPSLLEGAMEKVENMLDTTGLRRLIRPSAMRAKMQKTGDTNTRKEFANGFYKLSDAGNPKIWRQESYKYGFIDDYDAVRSGSKIAGSTKDLIDKRFNSYSKTKKVFYVSSPELSSNSNILEVYLMGDQRKWKVPCPCCGTEIELCWSVPGKNGIVGGITWKLDDDHKLISNSVGYTCQECGDFFTENGNTVDAEGNENLTRNKMEWIGTGSWVPTATPFRPDFYSYHMSALYSPPGMADWQSYVYKWLEIHPFGGKRREKKYQTFLNIDLGLPYDGDTQEAPNASDLQLNIRNYKVNEIPDSLSVRDGNGKIVLLTLAADMNGTEHDARVDWEVLGHSVTGSVYSVAHGSIGTFVPREGEKKADRAKWSYQQGSQRCVWEEMDKVMATIWAKDSGGKMRIALGILDSGKYTNHVYAYQERSNFPLVCAKGDKEDRYLRASQDLPIFKPGKERPDLYILEVGRIKDRLAESMKLKNFGDKQPAGFMNYPSPGDGLYSFANFFKHYEAEHRTKIEDKDGVEMLRWVKKTSTHQNHFWDVRVYNMAAKEIVIKRMAKEFKNQNFSWDDFCKMVA